MRCSYEMNFSKSASTNVTQFTNISFMYLQVLAAELVVMVEAQVSEEVPAMAEERPGKVDINQ